MNYDVYSTSLSERFIWTCYYLKLKLNKHNIKKASICEYIYNKVLHSVEKYFSIPHIHVSCWNRDLKLQLLNLNYIV